MLTVRELYDMSQLDMTEIDKTDLIDIREVKIDASLPANQKMDRYMEQINNPYFFLWDGSIIHVRFVPAGDALRDKLKHFFMRSMTM